MAVYRYQVVSVGWWRGKIKRWNTTFHVSSPSLAANIKNIMNATGWPNPGDVTGACSGGVASIRVYNSTGGAPISVNTYFDWLTPSTWIPYTGTAWSGVSSSTPLDASGESAAVIIGNISALSKSGKPVTTRKYLHAVPSRTAAAYSDPDIAPAVATALAAQFPSSIMATPAGVAPASVTCAPYYLNHQRVRGRRRSKALVSAQSFASGVVVGAQPSTSGGGQPFQAK